MTSAIKQNTRYSTCSGDLTQLLASLQSACKAVAAAVRRAGISQLFGAAGNTNVQGEEVKKLDVLANDLFINMLRSSYAAALLVSEENENEIHVETERQGRRSLSSRRWSNVLLPREVYHHIRPPGRLLQH